jgi:hypothetical protein
MGKIKRITIVGGGSAGWMTAAALVKAFPEKEIFLVESPDIPTVGVGESTLGGINDYCNYLGIDEKDFMRYTDASFKLSIKFTDFYEKDAGYFHYPFGSPFFDNVVTGHNDWLRKKVAYPDTDVNDYSNCLFPQAALYENNKFALNNYGIYDNYNPKYDAAYHFDATKFGLWLKEKYCIPRGVVHSVGEVVDSTVSENGIESLVLKDGKIITSDLFIDCTGFKSLLLGQILKEPFTSYNDILPNNRAWATQLPYVDKEKELEPFTNSTAIGHGWVWNIPLWSRIGTGYVYSDKYISPEDALKELKDHLCSDKMIIKRSKEQVDSLVFKDIKIKVGIHERTYVKNVVAIGLSAGFIEPLESNGLFSVHEFLFKLIKTLLRGKVTQWDKDVYNAATLGIFRNFAEFVALHYALSVRDDTPYWKENSSRVYSKEMIKQDPTNYVGFYQVHDKKMFQFLAEGNGGINYIATGMNYFFSDVVDQTLDQNYRNINFKTSMKHVFNHMEERKKRWIKAAENEKTLYQYLKDNIHNQEPNNG